LSGGDPAANAVLGFLAGAIGEADNRQSGNAVLEVGLDLDGPGVEPDKRMGDCSCVHVVIEDNQCARNCAESAPDV
jgi:hypothetical protein